METKYTKYLFIVAFAIILLLSFLIIKPLITVFLWSLILSYLFYPTYVYINRRLKRPSLSSFFTVLLMVLLVTVPFFFIIKGISSEAIAFTQGAKKQMQDGTVSVGALTDHCRTDTTDLCGSVLFLDNSIKTLLPPELMQKVTDKFITTTFNTIGDFIFKLPSIFFHIAISFFITFFLIRDWEKFKLTVYEYIPFKKGDMDRILHRINTMTHSIVFAAILVAMIQGVLGMIGYFVVGLPSPVLLGAITGFFGLIPVIGTGIVWVPASLFLMGKGLLLGSNLLLYQGIGLFLYGLLIIGTLDNFLRPKLAGDAAKVHPVVIIAGVIGGLKLFGFIGIFVGPVILALLITFISLALEKYHVEYSPSAKEK